MDEMGAVERRGAVGACVQVMAVVMACLACGCAHVQPELAQVSQPPGAWQCGGPARAFLKPNDPAMIVIRQTVDAHYRVENFLGKLRHYQPRSYDSDDALWEELEGSTEKAVYPPWEEYYPSEEETLVVTQLHSRTKVTFAHLPLEQVVAFLQQTTEPDYVLITRDVPPDGAPVTLDADKPLERILDDISTLTGLSWTLRHGAIVIGAAQSLRTYEVRVYPVRDLLIPFEDLRSGKPIQIDMRDLQARAERLLIVIQSVCFQDP